MTNLQKMGGITALIHSAAYLVGIALYLTALSPILDAAPNQYVVMLANYQSLLYVWIFIAYLVAGFCLVVVAQALQERLKSGSPTMMQTATILGFIWAGLIIGSGNLMLHGFGQVADIYGTNPAQAETVWITLKVVENGIVSANELIGGVWVLLLSWVALRGGLLNKPLNIFGLVIGAAGIISVVPALAEAGTMIFGLSMIVWFAWVGVIMLRSGSTTTVKPDMSTSRQSATA